MVPEAIAVIAESPIEPLTMMLNLAKVPTID